MDERMMYPSHAGIMTFLRAPYVKISEVNEGDYAVLGVPYDVTIGTRPGARYAPNGIREQTPHFLYHLTAIDGEVIDVETKRIMKSEMKPILKDVGDIKVYPTSVEKTNESIKAAISEIVARGATPVGLGGDHYVTGPLVTGFEDGYRRRMGRDVKIGYIHVDSHMDMYDDPELWGKWYQGSPARRVSELESVDMKNMVWVGINGNTGLEGYMHAINGGGTILTSGDVEREGIRSVMKRALSIAGDGVDCIYVTIDIDAVDTAYACGTGCYVYGGINAVQLLEIGNMLGECDKIGGIDLVEVSPPLDPSGNTCKLAASTLINFLKPRLFEFREG